MYEELAGEKERGGPRTSAAVGVPLHDRPGAAAWHRLVEKARLFPGDLIRACSPRTQELPVMNARRPLAREQSGLLRGHALHKPVAWPRVAEPLGSQLFVDPS